MRLQTTDEFTQSILNLLTLGIPITNTGFNVNNFPSGFDVNNFPLSFEVSNFPLSFEVSNFPASITGFNLEVTQLLIKGVIDDILTQVTDHTQTVNVISGFNLEVTQALMKNALDTLTAKTVTQIATDDDNNITAGPSLNHILVLPYVYDEDNTKWIRQKGNSNGSLSIEAPIDVPISMGGAIAGVLGVFAGIATAGGKNSQLVSITDANDDILGIDASGNITVNQANTTRTVNVISGFATESTLSIISDRHDKIYGFNDSTANETVSLFSGKTVAINTVLTIHIFGTFVATVTVEVSLDGSNWISLYSKNAGTSPDLTTTIISLQALRCTVSGYTSGTVNIAYSYS